MIPCTSFVFSAGNLIPYIDGSFVLRMVGLRFPQTASTSVVGAISLTFSAPTSVYVDFGDGNSTTYNTTSFGGNNVFYMGDKGINSTQTLPPYATAVHVYADETSSPRIISFNFDNNLLTGITVALMILSHGDLDFEFANYSNLKTFNFQQVSSVVNLNLLNASLSSQLTSIYINNTFTSTSPYYNYIPLELLNMPLISLGVGTEGFGASNFETNNMASIVNCAATLQTLIIQGANIGDDDHGEGALPANFVDLVNLRSLGIYGTLHTTFPAVINSMTWLTSLNMAYTGHLTGFGDFSALTNLTALSTASTPNLSVTLPSWLNSLIKLKSWNWLAVGSTIPGALDTFVGNIYSFVTTNAPITGVSTDPFRNMSFNISPYYIGDGTEIPSGTFQQPTGYILGSSNGSPASSLEMIWVMTNQYKHSWVYRTV